MVESSVITEEMRRAIGVESKPFSMEIEKGAIKKFADAIDDPNPLWRDEEYAKKSRYGGIIAPPTFSTCIRDDDLMRPVLGLECSLKRLLNGGNEFEYFQPIRPGDTISVTLKLTDVQEREAKTGKTLFMYYDVTYRNQRGEIVVIQHNTIIRR